jgi:hypothetical protein
MLTQPGLMCVWRGDRRPKNHPTMPDRTRSNRPEEVQISSPETELRSLG